MSGLSSGERDLIEPIEAAPLAGRMIAWANVNSGTGNLAGVAAMAELLADAFAVLPGEGQLVDPAPVEQVTPDGAREPLAFGRHYVMRVRPEADRRVLLTGHMDTVYPADDPFQACRWLDEGTIHGPGTADMKGGLSLMLAGLQAFERSEPQLGYDVMINSDEETSSQSSAALIRELAQGKLAALTYEPGLPDGSMARARPGSGNFSVTIGGRSAHAGREPERGRNAIVAASDLALRLARAKDAGLKINPARIDGGGGNNRVPDHAILRFNIRPATPSDQQRAEQLIAGLIASIGDEHDVSIDLHGGFGRPPKPVGAGTEALFALVSRTAADLGGGALNWQDTGGVCDGNNIAACGVPVIDTMGAKGGDIHSASEYCDVPSLAERAGLTALVLFRIEQGEL